MEDSVAFGLGFTYGKSLFIITDRHSLTGAPAQETVLGNDAQLDDIANLEPLSAKRFRAHSQKVAQLQSPHKRTTVSPHTWRKPPSALDPCEECPSFCMNKSSLKLLQTMLMEDDISCETREAATSQLVKTIGDMAKSSDAVLLAKSIESQVYDNLRGYSANGTAFSHLDYNETIASIADSMESVPWKACILNSDQAIQRLVLDILINRAAETDATRSSSYYNEWDSVVSRCDTLS